MEFSGTWVVRCSECKGGKVTVTIVGWDTLEEKRCPKCEEYAEYKSALRATEMRKAS